MNFFFTSFPGTTNIGHTTRSGLGPVYRNKNPVGGRSVLYL